MSKKNNDGDVLSNKIAVNFAAKESQLLASLFGGAAVTESHDTKPSTGANDRDQHADLKFTQGDDEGFGVGAIVPEEVQNGSFTNRIPTSMDKLLETIVGKKAAKEHLALKQKEQRANLAAQPPKKFSSKPAPKDESDEEEGRSAAFKSKRQRRSKPAPSVVQQGSDDEDEESRSSALPAKKQKIADSRTEEADEADAVAPAQKEDAEDEDIKTSHAVKPRTVEIRKSKPKSYLDELIDQKSKKKKNKKKSNSNQ